MSGKSGGGYPGQAGLWPSTSPFNGTTFLIKQLLGLVRTATLVQVQKCTTNDEVGAVGFVDVIPLVNMIDGLGNSFPHGTLAHLCYARAQGGKNAIICDPVKGDIGIAIFADRDISAVKKTKKQSNPGTRRQHDLADGVYLFGVLNEAPTQWIRFIQDDDGAPIGLEIVDVYGNKIVFSEDGITTTDKFGNTVVMTTDGITITDKFNNSTVMSTNGVTTTDKFGNKIEMVSAGIKINGVLFDSSKNVSAIVDLTNTGNASLGGGSQFLKRADGTNTTKVKGT